MGMSKTPEYKIKAVHDHRQRVLDNGGRNLNLLIDAETNKKLEKLAKQFVNPKNGKPSVRAALINLINNA